MFVSTTDAVLRSTNQFQSLEKSLDASAIYSLFATKQGKVLAGGTGKVFVSEDSGITWDSVGINTIYPIKQFIENRSGELFAITGVYEDRITSYNVCYTKLLRKKSYIPSISDHLPASREFRSTTDRSAQKLSGKP